MEQYRIPDAAALEKALAAARFLLVKHSPICPRSARAFREYEAFVRAGLTVHHGWIDVIGQRPLARWVATNTGVPHESPQALAWRAGRLVWHASHGAIVRTALERACEP